VRRWLRRLGIAVLALVVALTVSSFAYDAATSGRERPASELYAGPFVTVDGTQIAYRRWGSSGPPIELLGGFVEPSFVWQRVGALLGRRYRVVALDLPPFGYSQRRGPYTLAHWVELARAVAARLRLVRPLVVGHSLGAAVAVADALADPHGVRGIVLLDGDALPVGGPHWLARLALDPYYTSLFRIVTGSDWIVGRALRGALGPHAPKQSHAALAQWERPFRVSGTPAAFKQLLEGGVPGVSLADLAHVRIPALVVWGAEDSVDSVAAGRTTARALRARFVTIPGAGHLSMLRRPALVAAAIESASGSRAGRTGST
jgi:pimeloyl-ACP methyl ester carboxylesterase